MTSVQSVCNYALLRFLPYPQTGEFVNVGVVVSCLQPCLLDFRMEPEMTERLKAMFPKQNEQTFKAAAEAVRQELQRVKDMIRDPKTCQITFNEVIRPRESTFRFSEPKTILTAGAEHLAAELFGRYVRMETQSLPAASLAAV